MVGLERLWAFFGTPDLGPVDFEALNRRTTPNDALICPPDFCKAERDLTPPVFAADVAALRAAMARVIATEPRTMRVESNEFTQRYIQRSAILRFPDTIVVRFIERPDGSTLAMYSRSQLGYSDLGVNLSRLKRWLRKLTIYVAPANAQGSSD